MLLANAPIDCASAPRIYALSEGLLKSLPCHEGQELTWLLSQLDNIRVLIVLAGWRSGKSEIGPPWLLSKIKKHGPQDYQIVTTTLKLFNNRILPLSRALFEKRHQLCTYRAQDKILEFTPEGLKRLFGTKQADCRILMGYAEDPDSLEASTLGAVWGDESGQKHFKEDSHETIESRVMTTGGPILYTSRPYLPNWLVKMARDAGYKANWRKDSPDAEPKWSFDGDKESARVAVVNYSSLMNPAFEEAEYWRKKEEMPEWKHRMKYDGVYTKPAGAIYDCFDRKLHTYKGELPEWWPRHVAVDFGPVNTAACFAQEDPGDGTLYVYAAYRGPGETASIHVPKINLAAFPGDWDEERREFDRGFGGSWSEQDWRTDYAGAGLALERPPIREVEVGIQRLYRLFKLGKLKIHEGLEWLIAQVEDYSRELDDEGEPKESIEDKEKFHGCDSLRYLASGLRPTDEWSQPVIVRGGEKDKVLVPQEADKPRFEHNSRIMQLEKERREDRGEEEAGFESPVVY